MAEILRYDRDSERFLFSSNNTGAVNIHGVCRVRHGDRSSWGMPATYPDGLQALKDFKRVFPSGKAETSAVEQIEYLKSVPKLITDLDRVNSTTYPWKAPPMAHQLECIETMLHHQSLAILAAMGLGKTYIALNHMGILNHENGPTRSLVLAPKIVIRNWVDEAEKFTDLKAVLYRGTSKQRRAIRERILGGEPWDLIVTNYEAIIPRKNSREDCEFFKGLEYDCLYLDEGSRVKGAGAKRSKVVKALADKATRKYILSGSLCLGNPLDVYMPFTILNDRIFGASEFFFKKKYLRTARSNKHIVVGYKNLDHMKSRMDPYLISKNRDDCLALPERTVLDVPYTLSAEQRKMYNDIINKDVITVSGREIHVELAVVKLTKLMQVLSGFITIPPEEGTEMCGECDNAVECAKRDVFPWDGRCVHYDQDNPAQKPVSTYYEFKANPKLERLIETIESTDEKVIVWGYYRKDIDVITDYLKKEGVAHVTADVEDCDKIFNENEDMRVFVGQISQGIGITLNSATVMVYYGYSLGLEPYLQSMERNYRIGQTRKVLMQHLVCPESVEEHTLKLLAAKTDVKDFIQTKVECEKCPNSMRCFSEGIEVYSPRCCLHEMRVAAEEKKKIEITEVA